MSGEKKERKDPRPLCKICEHRHWSHEPHVFPDSKPKKRKRSRNV